VAELRWQLGLYLRLVKARIRSQLQYRLSFALDLSGTFFITFIDFLAVVVIFAHLPRLSGWTLAEVAFFYGTANIAFALCDLIVGHLDLLPAMIRDGSFDLILVRPAGSLFQILAADFTLRRLGRVLQGAAVLLFALSRLHIVWTLPRVIALATMLLTGTIIYACIWIIAITITFFTVDTREIANAFTYGGSFLASYPINIFGGWVRRLLAFVVPLAFVSYFPGLLVLDHPDPLRAPAVVRYCTPLVAMVLVLVASRTWGFGTRHYRSTGS